MNSSKKKQEFKIESIKTPDGNVPTVESFHKVIDGLFGEVLDTRKDIAKLIPNLEKELNNLREILAKQMIFFEIINSNIENLEKSVKKQEKAVAKIQKETEGMKTSVQAEAELTSESQKAIAKVIHSEITGNIKPILTSIKKLEKDVSKSGADTVKSMEKSLVDIKDQLEDLSSKSELQMLEILESVNQKPTKTTSKSSSSRSSSKKKVSS